jgi:hypothetical protein
LFYCLICRVSDPTRCLGNNGIVIVCNLRQQATSRNISLVNTIKSVIYRRWQGSFPSSISVFRAISPSSTDLSSLDRLPSNYSKPVSC